MSTPPIVIASAARTAVGSFNGAFADTPAHELGAAVIKSALEPAEVEASEVDEVILGQVLPADQGQNPARQAAMKARIPQEATAWRSANSAVSSQQAGGASSSRLSHAAAITGTRYCH